MALNNLGLGFLFNAQDMASGTMKKLGANLKGLEEQSGHSIGNIDQMVSKLSGGLAAMAIGAGGLAAAFSLAGASAKFEMATAQVGAVANATTEELVALEDAAISLSKSRGFKPTEAMLGLNELAQAGFDAKTSIELLDPVLLLAAGSLGDLNPQEAAGVISQTMKAFAIETKDAGIMVDQMLGAGMDFATGAKDLPIALGRIASGSIAMNQNMTESMIAFGMVKNVIGGAEVSATALNSAMLRLADPEVSKMMKGQGVAVADSNGKFRDFLDVVADLQPALGKMTEQGKAGFLKKAFGEDALKAVMAISSQMESGVVGVDGLLRKGGEVADYYRNRMINAGGVGTIFADKMLATFEGVQKQLAGSMETFAIKLGDPFREIFKPVMVAVTMGLDWMTEVLKGMSPEVKKWGALLLVGGSALLLLAGAMSVGFAIAPLFAGGLTALSIGFTQFSLALGSTLLAAWPFVLAGIAIAAIVYAIKENIGGMGDVWDRVVGMFAGGGDTLKNIFGKVLAFVTPLWDALKEGFGVMWERMQPIFGMLATSFDVLLDAFSRLGALFDSTASGPGSFLMNVFRGIGKVIGWVLGVVIQLITYFVFFASIVAHVFTGLVGVVMTIFTALYDGIAWFVDAFTSWMKVLGKGIDVVKGWLGIEVTAGPVEDKEAQPDAYGSVKYRGMTDPTAPTAPTDPTKPNDEITAAAEMAALKAPAASPFETGEKNADQIGAAVAKAMQKMPLTVNMDGQKVGALIAAAGRADMARSSSSNVGSER